MKKIVLLFFILAAATWAFQVLGKKEKSILAMSPEERMQKRFELREKMREKMRRGILNGVQDEDRWFRDIDRMMDQMSQEALRDLESMSQFRRGQRGSNSISQLGTVGQYKTQWSENSTGRVLIITPSSPQTKLSLNVTEHTISIEGKSESKDKNFYSSSSFADMISVPEDVDGKNVKMSTNDKGEIVVTFPFKTGKSGQGQGEVNPDRRPLESGNGEIEI